MGKVSKNTQRDEIVCRTQSAAIGEIARELRRTPRGGAPFAMIIGAGFSYGLVPLAEAIVNKYLPAWQPTKRRFGHFDPASPRVSKRAADFWRSFQKENANDLAKYYPDFSLTPQGLPGKVSAAYEAAFDPRMTSPVSSPILARQFHRDLIRPDEPRMNDAHFYLALLLGDLNQLPGIGYSESFPENVTLSREVFSVNFDNCLETALRILGQPYCTSDRVFDDPDDIKLSHSTNLTHVIYVHGSVHRRIQAANAKTIREIEKSNVDAIRLVLERQGLIILGYGGWSDALRAALLRCKKFERPVFWCDLHESPNGFEPEVREILHNPCVRYVNITNADSFMRELWTAVVQPSDGHDEGTPRNLSKAVVTWVSNRVAQVLPLSIRNAADEGPQTGGIEQGQVDEGKPSRRIEQRQSLCRAIEEAEPGTRLILPPGTYRESLVIDKDLELVGDGAPEDIRVDASGDCALRLLAKNARVSSITFCQRSSTHSATIEIGPGGGIVERCCVEGKGVGVRIRGPKASAIIRGNRIRECGEGVVVGDEARPELSANTIYNNAGCGLVVEGRAAPTVNDNRMHNNGHVGVLVRGADGHFEKNVIYSNGREGVAVHNGANPTFVDNTIQGNVKAGVYFFDSGKGRFEKNTILSNQNSGIAIRTSGCPIITENKVHANNGKGVWAADGAAGEVRGNYLGGNPFGNYWCSPNSTTVFEDNRDYEQKA